MEGKYILVSGPIIIEENKLLVIKDIKDEFYKLPGGTVKQDEDFEEACIRETKEEINGIIKIMKPINPLVLWKNPKTGEPMTIVLMHYFAELKNKEELKCGEGIKEIVWLDISEIKGKKYSVAPNINYVLKRIQK